MLDVGLERDCAPSDVVPVAILDLVLLAFGGSQGGPGGGEGADRALGTVRVAVDAHVRDPSGALSLDDPRHGGPPHYLSATCRQTLPDNAGHQ